MSQPPRVAVIAVHGVADQQPGDSARAVAGLLLQLDADGNAMMPVAQPATRRDDLYARFEASTLHIPLRPLTVSRRATRRRRRVFQLFEEHEPDESADDGDCTTPPSTVRESDTGRVGYAYFSRQLANYDPGARTPSFVTTILEGTRTTASGDAGPHIAVDVYEIHWADLSRLGRGVTAFFTGLYGAVVHLSALGRQAIDAAIEDEADGVAWRRYRSLHAWTIRLLVLFVPVINFSILLASLALLTTVYATKPASMLRVPPSLLLAACWAAGGLVMWSIMRRYERVRPGASVVGLGVYAVMLIVLTASLHSLSPSAKSRRIATMWSIQAAFALHTVTWLTLFLSALAAWLVGWWLVRVDRRTWLRARRTDDEADSVAPLRARAARTAAVTRTARVSMAVSLIAVLIPLQVGWSGILGFVATRLEPFNCLKVESLPVSNPSLQKLLAFLVPDSRAMAWWVRDPERLASPDRESADGARCREAGTQTLFGRQYLTALVLISLHTAFPVTLMLFLGTFVLLAAAAIPSVKFEGKVASIASTNGEAARAGRSLSRGLDAASIATELMWLGAFPVLFASWIWDEAARVWDLDAVSPPSLGWMHEKLLAATLPFVQPRGALVAATVVFLLGALARRGGSALDVLLDVVNYLRVFPRRGTPAARIAERYASLLRHVAAYRRDGEGYAAVVIVAHSLGSVITTDVLRALRRQANARDGDPRLASLGFGPEGERAATIPIHLFTMGTPLRQSLNRYFPHRFRWVRDEPDNGMRPLNAQPADDPSRASAPACPCVTDLGLSHWSNAYRSGDYVGRSLWLTEWYARNECGDAGGRYPEALRAFASPAGDRWEACIGLGAHTHYWDSSAPDVAQRLDELIRTAARAAPRRPRFTRDASAVPAVGSMPPPTT